MSSCCWLISLALYIRHSNMFQRDQTSHLLMPEKCNCTDSSNTLQRRVMYGKWNVYYIILCRYGDRLETVGLKFSSHGSSTCVQMCVCVHIWWVLVKVMRLVNKPVGGMVLMPAHPSVTGSPYISSHQFQTGEGLWRPGKKGLSFPWNYLSLHIEAQADV